MFGMRNKLWCKRTKTYSISPTILLCSIIAVCRKLCVFIRNHKFIGEIYHPQFDVIFSNFVHPIHPPERNMKEQITYDLQATANTTLSSCCFEPTVVVSIIINRQLPEQIRLKWEIQIFCR